MLARDIMTRDVISVHPDAALGEVVERLLQHRISGVAVVEQDKVVGFVGHGDLLHRHEIGTDTPRDARSWWQRLMGFDASSQAYVRTHSRRVRDVMNPDVVTIAEDAPVAQVATLFEARHIRRLVVEQDESLSGLVTRCDLVRALAMSSSQAQAASQSGPIHDDQIRQCLLHELKDQPWWHGDWSNFFVHGGVVYFAGVARSRAEQEAARVAAENIPGVRAVRDQRQVGIEAQPIFL